MHGVPDGQGLWHSVWLLLCFHFVTCPWCELRSCDLQLGCVQMLGPLPDMCMGVTRGAVVTPVGELGVGRACRCRRKEAVVLEVRGTAQMKLERGGAGS